MPTYEQGLYRCSDNAQMSYNTALKRSSLLLGRLALRYTPEIAYE
jgi:hypothetical protein